VLLVRDRARIGGVNRTRQPPPPRGQVRHRLTEVRRFTRNCEPEAS